MTPGIRTARTVGASDLALAFEIREIVFVGEQAVPLELERDADDEAAEHFLAWQGERAVGAGRLIVEPGGVAHLGRLAVLADARGTGAGVALVRAIEARACELGLRSVRLSAQTQALGFYERLGYSAEGPVFDDAGIPHRWMTKPIG